MNLINDDSTESWVYTLFTNKNTVSKFARLDPLLIEQLGFLYTLFVCKELIQLNTRKTNKSIIKGLLGLLPKWCPLKFYYHRYIAYLCV